MTAEETKAAEEKAAADKAAKDEADKKTLEFSERWNHAKQTGKDEGFKDALKELGVNTIDEAKAILDKGKSKPDPKIDEALREHREQLAALKLQNETLQQSIQMQTLDTQIGNAISEYKPKLLKTALRELKDDYDFRPSGSEILVYKKGGTVPLPDTLPDLVKKWATDPVRDFLFDKTQGLDGKTLPGAQRRERDPAILRNHQYVAAMKTTGQYDNYMEGKPVDWATVDALVKGK